MSSRATAGETTPLLKGSSRQLLVSRSLKDYGVNMTKPLGDGYGKACSAYDKLFYKDVNKEFGEHLETACRGAFFILLFALPFLLPPEVCPDCRALTERKLYSVGSVSYIIYSLYVTTGDTIHFAQGGATGCAIAALNCWMMQGFMPGGYTEETPERWWIGVAWGVLFTFMMLWLNYDGNTRVFALSTFVGYWMTFLNPEATTGFAQNFEIKIGGEATSAVIIAVLGCILAIAASLLPYPQWAHEKGLKKSRRLLEQMYMTKKDFLAYYRGNQSDPMKLSILSREMETMRTELNGLPGLIDSAWFESFGSTVWKHQRKMMVIIVEYITSSLDLLQTMFQICKDENFDQSHIDVMKETAATVEEVIDHNGEILKICIGAVFAGSWDASLADEVEERCNYAQESVKKLTTDFRNARAVHGLNRISKDSAGESVLVLLFCKFTDLTCKLCRDLQEADLKNDGSTNLITDKDHGVLGIFSPTILMDKDHLSWVFRNGTSILVAFAIGHEGYNLYIEKYNAAISSTVCVLLSNFIGSAMTKNMNRLQGVVLGIVLGNLLYALLGWCYWWAHLLTMIALFCWSVLGLFLYYHSTNYSTAGVLLAVFGAGGFLRPCANSLTNPEGIRQSITNATVGIVVMTIIDMVFSQKRASELAQEAFDGAWQPLRIKIKLVLGNEGVSKEDEALAATLSGKIALAATLGREAAAEPRYWRHPWPEVSFERAVKCFGTLDFCLNTIQQSVFGDEKKSSEIEKYMKLPSLIGPGGVKDILSEHAGNVMEAVDKSLDDKANHDVFIRGMKELDTLQARTSTELWRPALQKYMDELSRMISHQSQITTLASDNIAILSIFTESLRAMFEELDALLASIVQSQV